MTDPKAKPAHPILDLKSMRRLILVDLLLVAVLGWLLWSVWTGAQSQKENPNPAPPLPEIETPAALEGLGY